MFGYISENSKNYTNGWVPTVNIKNDLNLKVSAYPKNKDNKAKGWLFGIAARRLEDMDIYRV